ncbi:hypothetical protein, partial [Brevundimonas sp.]
MKRIALVSAVAVVAFSGVANAQSGTWHLTGENSSPVSQPWTTSLDDTVAFGAWAASFNYSLNNGTAANNDGATFTLKGNVTKDCSFYSGSSTNQTLD